MYSVKSKKAYAYMTFNKGKILSEVSAKRLNAISSLWFFCEFTQSNSNFKYGECLSRETLNVTTSQMPSKSIRKMALLFPLKSTLERRILNSEP